MFSLKEILKFSSRLSIITDIERIVLGKNLYVYRTPLPCNFCRGRSLNKSIIWVQLFSELSYHKSLNSTQSFSLQIYSEKCFHQTHKSVIRRTHFIAELYFSGTKKKGRYIQSNPLVKIIWNVQAILYLERKFNHHYIFDHTYCNVGYSSSQSSSSSSYSSSSYSSYSPIVKSRYIASTFSSPFL